MLLDKEFVEYRWERRKISGNQLNELVHSLASD